MTNPILDPLEYAEDPTIDVVDRIYGSGHSRYCNYKPEYSASGLVYCRTCTCQINSLVTPNGPADNYQVLKSKRKK